MGFLMALRRPSIAWLWVSQVLSSMGDYLYNLAVIWIAVRTAGSGAGIVAAAEAASQLVFGLLGGVYADRWDRRAVMVVVDIIRAGTVGLIAILALSGAIQFWELVAAAIIIGSLGSLFEPALQASLPTLAGDVPTLQATNGLMDVTTRLARALGPSMAGLLVLFMPLAQFFTLDAVSYIISSLAILSLGRHVIWKDTERIPATAGIKGIWSDIRGAITLVSRHKPLSWAISLNGVMNLAWSASFVIGVPLLVNQVLKSNVGALGLIIGAYGVGNVISNLVMGSVHVRRPIPIIFVGKIVVGLGFMVLAWTHSLPLAVLASAGAAFGGPMGDITMLTIMQTELPVAQLGKVYSLRMVLANVGASLGLLIAVPMFAHLSVMAGISICAALMIVLGVIGLFRFGLFYRHPVDSDLAPEA
ncbi:MFS transporter [Dictyobacter aurantiacus]|uniref:MFS transporter n=1 Tax=Dictyobacter aurantiacus TaxID=1936993 RepID=A0A401ZC88_9CHLR|nr:MFS transporter [Dictyobacter aurantiacus]GCE04475.1 MFS transporter [Dictyobacter aurantiacus]